MFQKYFETHYLIKFIVLLKKPEYGEKKMIIILYFSKAIEQ